MPDIGGTIRTITLADGTISGLVGVRMFSDMMPTAKTFPSIVYRVISSVPTESLTEVQSITQARIEITAADSSRTGANALANAIRLALQLKHRGLNGAQFINSISMVGGEMYEIELDSKKQILWFETIQDFYVHYTTTTA